MLGFLKVQKENVVIMMLGTNIIDLSKEFRVRTEFEKRLILDSN